MYNIPVISNNVNVDFILKLINFRIYKIRFYYKIIN